ncbi:hypothetical protein BJX99DRAFT_255806 [Aspergillus californicus]
MASTTALVSEPVDKPQDEPSKPSSAEVSQPELKSPEDSKPNSTSANGISTEHAPVTDQEQPDVGDKRDIEATSTLNTAEKPNEEEVATEPSSKKQKTNGVETDAANGTSTTAHEDTETSQTPTEKKKPGRPKKTKDSIKKDIPTGGIGSRTRSRTKVVS